ncbi:MAG: sugar phosphate isomerase/epimerase [Candidatus Bathyarchaeota archaeon]|nr:sugar phosphate isomerase/epimerase [Candidatus Bathyarchaeota archaeon]
MPRPKIGISMLYCLSEPFSKMLKRLARVNVQLVEVVDEGLHELSKKRVNTLNEIARAKGISYTVHAPFADINIASPSKLMLNASIKRLEQSMAYANAINARLWVFHPGAKTGISTFYPEEDWKQNIQTIRELHETSEKYGLNTAIENLPEKYGFIMRNPEDFQKFYKETKLNDIGIALDVGHANLENQTINFIKKLPDKIVHIHLSDNTGETDQHLGIGYGKINWQQFAEALKEIAYDKNIIIETVEHIPESLEKLKQMTT